MFAQPSAKGNLLTLNGAAATTLPIETLIAVALASEELRRKASIILGDRIYDGALLHSPRDGMNLRGSDMGRCRLDLWFDLHGYEGEAIDFRSQLTKLDEGSLMGAWAAALLKAAVEAAGGVCELEMTVNAEDMPGHIDARVLYLGRRAVVDFKWSLGGYPAEPPDKQCAPSRAVDRMKASYQVFQVVKYALGDGSERSYIVTVSPAASASKPWFDVAEYDPETWRGRVEDEITRLSAALGDEQPTGDPQQFWRCGRCKWTQCEKHPRYTQPIAAEDFELATLTKGDF